MYANAGDRLVVLGAHVDDHVRDGLIIEVHGVDGAPPYLIRWFDNGHESVVFPGAGTRIVAAEHQS